MTDDQVVDDLDLHEFARFGQLPGQAKVFFAGLQISGRMVVAEDNGGGPVFEGGFKYHFRINHCPCHTAAAESMPAQHRIAAI